MNASAFDKIHRSREGACVFNRLCYLIAEGFDICSITGYDSEEEANARIVYRYFDTEGRFSLHTEIFRAGAEEMEASSNLFIDYLQSEGQG